MSHLSMTEDAHRPHCNTGGGDPKQLWLLAPARGAVQGEYVGLADFSLTRRLPTLVPGQARCLTKFLIAGHIPARLHNRLFLY